MPILHFKGKSVIQNHHHTVKFHELTPVKSKGTSKEPSLDDNLIIHGDNLIALKALLPTYAGKVKCIYIDPPYNTGNEHWVYNDNVSSPMIKEWLGKEVARDDLSRHDKWCCMMYPRLILLRELLREDGMIFISIDDNEISNLRILMSEIFGEENFLGDFIWKSKPQGGNDNAHIVTEHEYILLYSKQSGKVSVNERKLEYNKYKSTDEYKATRGGYLPTKLDIEGLPYRKNLDYPIQCPDKSYVYPGGVDKKIHEKRKADGSQRHDWRWRWSEERYNNAKKEGFIEFKKNSRGWQCYFKEYEFVDNDGNKIERGAKYRTLIEGVSTIQGTTEIIEIFGERFFQYPKPSSLITTFLKMATKGDDIVLDSFAGSGTTGHAVLALNAEDGGNRRFILAECEDYAEKLTAERVRRVSKGVKGAKDENLQKGLGGTFSYFELGKPIDIDKMLEGDDLPSFENLAHYAFFTSTGETFNPKKISEKDFYIGSNSTYEIFMLYTPDAKKLRELALNLDFAQKIEKKFPNKPKLVFAPACYLEEFDLRERNIRFAQLPFEIYRLAD